MNEGEPVRAPVLAVVATTRGAWDRAEAWGRTPLPVTPGLELGELLDVVPAGERPWLQRTVRAAVSGVRGWLRGLPDRAAGWGAGADRSRCAW